MRSVLVTPPASSLVTLSDAKEWLRVDSSAEDVVIDSLVSAANDYLDGPYGVLGRALVTQTWALQMNGFPSGRKIELPVPVVRSVSSVTYYDAENAEQTFASDQYRVVLQGDDALIELVEGANWPATYYRTDAATITYVSGYGDSVDVPAAITASAKLLVANWFENRQAATEKSLSDLPFGVRSLLMNHRLPRGLI